MRKTMILTLVMAALAVAHLRPAAALPASEHLDAFISQLETYAGQLDPNDPEAKLQSKLVKKAQKLLKKKSASLATDATLAAKLAKFMDKGGPELVGLADAAADAVASIGENAEGLIQNVRSRTEDLPEGKFRDKAERSLAKIDEILADLDPSDLKAYAKAIKKALVERRKVAKAVNKGEALLDDL